MRKFPQNQTGEWKARGFKSASDANESAEALRQPYKQRQPAKRQQNNQRQAKPFSPPTGGAARGNPNSVPLGKPSTLFQQKPVETPEVAQTDLKSPKNKRRQVKTGPQGYVKKKKLNEEANAEIEEAAVDGEANEEPAGEAKEETKRKKQKFKGYSLFIGNLSYDTTKEDILKHFAKCGAIKDARIPSEKDTEKPRGFAYLEVEDHVTYENVLSLHHTFLKKRRINVEVTFGGSNTSKKRKSIIKEKTLRLRFLSREGKISSARKKPFNKKASA